MGLKKDAFGRRSIQVEIEVPGTPEEVWQAIATGPGISSWFVPARMEERDGKPIAVKMDFGPGMELNAVVTVWEPLRKWAARSDGFAPGAPPIACEWSVEARGGGGSGGIGTISALCASKVERREGILLVPPFDDIKEMRYMKAIQPALLRMFIGLQTAVSLAAAFSPDTQTQGPHMGDGLLPASMAASSDLAGFSAGQPHPSAPPGIGRQLLGGLAYGSGGMLAGGAAGAGLLGYACWQWGEDCGFAGLGGAFVGGIFGFASAFPLGVYRFGTDENVSGSLKWTYVSALLGTAVGFGGWALASGLDDEDTWFQSAMIGTAAAPIGALIGFNATRGLHKGVPEISLAPRNGGGWAGRLTWHLGMAP